MSAFARYFRQQLLLTRIFGIPVRIDYRWFPALILLSAITAASVNSLANDLPLSLAMGFAATIVFFASIFLHELAHALIARIEHLEVVEIVLHPFGGLARFRHEPETPRAEFNIAIAGPAASFLLALFFAALMAGANFAGTDILALFFFLLALSNFLLAMFNLFPGYPLDGGRILRAYLWKSGKDLSEATILTGRCGQLIAVGLILVGFLAVGVRGEFFSGFWAILVGLFLYDSAKGIISEVRQSRQILVDDVMELALPVSPEATLQKIIDGVVPVSRQTIYPVALEKHLYGMLLLEDVKAISADSWRQTRVRQVMRPVEDEQFVELGSSLLEAKALLRVNKLGIVAVVDSEGKLVGMLRG